MKAISAATFFTVLAPVLVLALALDPALAQAESYKCLSVDQDVQINVMAPQTMNVLNPTQQGSRQLLISFSASSGNLVFNDTTATAKITTTTENANKRLAGTTLNQLDTISITFDTGYRQATTDGKPMIAAQVAYTRHDQQRLTQDFTCAID